VHSVIPEDRSMPRKRLASSLLVILSPAFVLQTEAAAQPEKPVRLAIDEVRLVNPNHNIGKSPSDDGLISSPDAMHVAYIAKQGGKKAAVIDGVAGKPYDWIQAPLIFSPNNRRLAYLAGIIDGDKLSCHLVIDGIESKGYGGIAWHQGMPGPFSPDSRRIAFTVKSPSPLPLIGTTGSGFLVSPEGYVVTCAHVVKDASLIRTTIGGRTYSATLITTHGDVALLKIDARELPFIALGDSEGLELGSDVHVLGYPRPGDLGRTVKV